MNHKKAIILTCFVALIWSLAGLNIKVITWAPYAIPGGRGLIAALLLAPMVIKSKNKQINRYVIGCAVCYTAFNYCFIASTKLTTSAIAIIMQYTAPIYVAMLSWTFLRERVTKVDIVSLICVFTGMLLFFMDSTGCGRTLGNVIAIFNGVTFAGISIFLRLQKNGDPVISMFLGNVFSAIVGIPFMSMAGFPDKTNLFLLLILGALAALSYAIYAKASTSLSALEIVLLPVIDPIMNPVWVFLIIGEKPGTVSIVGAVIILISVTLRVIWGIEHDGSENPA